MAKSNRICFLCGKKYLYCNTCGSDINKPSWYTMWCSETCKDLDRILAAHTMQQITTEEAKNKIENLKLNNINFIDENVKKHYNEIMSYEIQNDKNNVEEKKDNNITSVKIDDVEKSYKENIALKTKTNNVKMQNNKKK